MNNPTIITQVLTLDTKGSSILSQTRPHSVNVILSSETKKYGSVVTNCDI